MNPGTKNKLLTALVLLLLLANAATLVLFWTQRSKTSPPPKGLPDEYLVKELKLDTRQQEQLKALVNEHRAAVRPLREKMKAAKDNLFDLTRLATVPDSVKHSATTAISGITEEIDLLTLEHFRKIRALCTAEQQQKFDEILHQVAAMLGAPGPHRPEGDHPPPPGH